jgi:hypothetical protein
VLYGENFVLLSADALEAPAAAPAAAGEETERVPVLKLLNYAEVRVLLLPDITQTTPAQQQSYTSA